MLDIKFIREHADLIKEASRKKHIEFNVSELIELDDKRLALLKDIEESRAKQNEASERIISLEESERESVISEMKILKSGLQDKEAQIKEIQIKWQALMYKVPNIPDISVPEGKSDEDNKELYKWGELPEFNFEPKNHIELMQSLNLADFERGAKVSGFRGYFLKNDAVLLSMALWQFTIDFLRERGVEDLFMAPSLVRGDNLVGTSYLPQSEDKVYQVEDDLYLAGTAEVAMMGLHKGEVFTEGDLPKTYLAFSPCFRSESGSYGKDEKGVFRVHEFFKLEQVVLCEANHEESVRWHETLIKSAQEFMQALKIPHRTVVNCGGDLGLGQVKKYDIEAWTPSQGKYRESHSASYFHDFQTRRLNIRYKDKEGKMRFVHSLNNTAIATPRILEALLENYQQADGTILIPDVLQKQMGKNKIS